MGPTCLLPSPDPSDVGLGRASPDCQVRGSSLMVVTGGEVCG